MPHMAPRGAPSHMPSERVNISQKDSKSKVRPTVFAFNAGRATIASMPDSYDSTIVTAALIIIGNEVLSGRTEDANLTPVPRGLGRVGVRLAEVRVVIDDVAVIAETVNQCRASHDYVFTTGGIGPTHDDVTAVALARAFGVAVTRHQEAARRLALHYGEDRLNESRLSMADMPEGAELIDNPVSQAPGFRMDNVFVMAGVPRIMEAMLDGVLPTLVGGSKVLSRTLSAELPESDLAAELARIQERYGETEIGSYPYFQRGCFGTSIVLRGIDGDVLERAAAEVRAAMVGLGAEPVETA